jgi:hypothetical protein
VGVYVSPFQIAAAIISQIPGLFIQDVEVAVLSLTQKGTLTSASNAITNLTYNAPTGGFVGIEAGMIVTDAEGNIPAATTITTLTGGTQANMSASATGSGDEILTFTNPSLTYQSTEIPIGIWQQAKTLESLITVLQA